MKNVHNRFIIQNDFHALETRESESDSISDVLKIRYFIKEPFYNFIYAEEELGLNFSDLSKNGFQEFLQSIYLNDLIKLRKAYIKRNYGSIRFLSHKFKSPFTLIGAKELKEACEDLQTVIDKGKDNIEKEYIKFLSKASEFLHELYQFSIIVNIPLNIFAVNAFIRENDKCNYLEDSRIKSYLFSNYNMISEGQYSPYLAYQNQIIFQDFKYNKGCCKCNIF